MNCNSSRLILFCCILISTFVRTVLAAPATIDLDATDVTRQILHARLQFPVQPGKLTLVYPKWLPGVHGPEGPVVDLAGLKMTANGSPVKWERDAVDMFAFHLDVPAGAASLDVSLDFLLPSGKAGEGEVSASSQLAVIQWHQVVLYPQGVKAGEFQFAASITLPAGWEPGTALPIESRDGEHVKFSPVSLETLVDSPVQTGAHFRTLDLSPGQTPAHYLHIAADSEAALDIKPEDVARFRHLVAEAGALFGARHYRSYHFLLTMSDHISHFGLEHHESSDNRVDEKFLTDEAIREMRGSLLPHEMVHSWNGKYRRPAGLATPNYQEPMKGELLWVYEGLTTYLGDLLAARSGLWTNSYFREALALGAASLDNAPGRGWRPLSDTAVAAQLLYNSRREESSLRRRTDFYPEGELIWFEADTIIRRLSDGKRSLDDFCKAFHGGTDSAPAVVPYSLGDVIATLKKVQPYDWQTFLQKRIYDIAPRAPMGGIENGGWQLAWTNEVPQRLKQYETAYKFTDLQYSLGMTISEDGVLDVILGKPAQKAGVGPGMKLVAVNGRKWTAARLREAVKETGTNSKPIELLVENDDYFKTCQLDYHGGESYPCLRRNESVPDLLGEIIKPLTSAPAVERSDR